MIATVFRRSTCGLCGGRNLELVLKLASTPAGDTYVPAGSLKEVQEVFPLDLFLCRACGGVQLLDVVDPKIVYGNYIYETSISLGLAEHFQKSVDKIMGYVKPSKGAFVVDIGSNDGTLLKFFKNQGMSVLGVDPAPHAAQKARDSGIETLQTFFTIDVARKIKDKRGPAAIVTANNVIANIDNLTDMIEGLRELMAYNGVFVFETGYLVDLIQKKLIDNIYHEHLSYYTVRSLEALFRRNGMELIDVERIPTKGGSLRGIVQLRGGGRTISPSVSQLIELETKLGAGHAGVFKDISAEINALKKKLLNFLRDLKTQEKTIAGYGASVGVTTLIYLFGLADILSFIVDDNPSRQNLFSPGHHIPVVSPQVIHERKPDYVLILAWRYSEPIIKKHQAYLKQGGHFIVPLPRLKVI